MKGLSTIMTHNVFRFGDTHWIQLRGTAMGAPPAPMYATLYFGILEQRFLSSFPECIFYRRYVDDGFGIWVPSSNTTNDHSNNTTHTENSASRWTLFQQTFDNICDLEWTFSPLTTSADFLDITISINNHNKIDTTVFEKALNLYLYLPPHSCHPKGLLNGLIHGMMLRFFRLSTSKETACSNVRRLLVRLKARGYHPKVLNDIMKKCYRRIFTTMPIRTTTTSNNVKPVFFHLPYHPDDPSCKTIQRVFDATMSQPPGEPPLPTLQNRDGYCFGQYRFIVSYSQHKNIGSLLSPRKLYPPGVNPSVILSKYSDNNNLHDDDDVGPANP